MPAMEHSVATNKKIFAAHTSKNDFVGRKYLCTNLSNKDIQIPTFGRATIQILWRGNKNVAIFRGGGSSESVFPPSVPPCLLLSTVLMCTKQSSPGEGYTVHYTMNDR